ncbi:MAG: YfbR-like 5'-deoxynucleotidase [Patescibacteria group bacterium]|jgi:5'-deoxynucleotidase YfbR-like HD superfamily hydrolase
MDIQLAMTMWRFQDIFGRLKKCIRWGGYKERHYEQSSLEHSFAIALLTAFCVMKEKELKGPAENFDPFRMVVHALVHDFCEGAIGDITYRFKNDPRLLYLVKLIEKEEGLRSTRHISFIGPFLAEAIILEPGSLEEKFFDAMERLDYFFYALAEYEIHKHLDFVAVFDRQHAKLVEYASVFPSVAMIYSQEVQEYVEKEMKTNWGLIGLGGELRPHKPCQKDVEDLEEALKQLLAQLAKQREASGEKGGTDASTV